MKYTLLYYYTNSITLLPYHVMKYTFYTIILLVKMIGHGNIKFRHHFNLVYNGF